MTHRRQERRLCLAGPNGLHALQSEFELIDDQRCELLQSPGFFACEARPGLDIRYTERSDALTGRRDEGSAGVESDVGRIGDHGVIVEVGMLACAVQH